MATLYYNPDSATDSTTSPCDLPESDTCFCRRERTAKEPRWQKPTSHRMIDDSPVRSGYS